MNGRDAKQAVCPVCMGEGKLWCAMCGTWTDTMKHTDSQTTEDAVRCIRWIDALAGRMKRKRKLVTAAIRRGDYRAANDLQHELSGMSDALADYTSASIKEIAKE
jgi:hypothetical protein